MFRTEVIYLISQSHTVDSYGDTVTTEISSPRFAEIKSIGEKEFYESQAIGLKPEIKFIMTDYIDYNDERYVEYNGERYRVLRTYRKDKSIELTCYREVIE